MDLRRLKDRMVASVKMVMVDVYMAKSSAMPLVLDTIRLERIFSYDPASSCAVSFKEF